jgi:hypothetical protein
MPILLFIVISAIEAHLNQLCEELPGLELYCLRHYK